MKLFIRGFSEEVEFQNPEKVAHFLVIVDEDTGNTRYLPVPQETVAALAAVINDEEILEDDENSSREETTEIEEPPPEQVQKRQWSERQIRSHPVPDSEDQVPSV